MIKVLKAGFYSTIQDQGRFGHRHYGVPVSGVMDVYAGEFANALLGNSKEDAVLEMTMVGAELQFTTLTIIAITGANMQPELNGKSIDLFKSIKVKPNDILSFKSASNGFRTYMAVKGGFLTEMVLGSRSMAKGISKKIRLVKNDELEFENTTDITSKNHAKLIPNASYLNETVLEVTVGPEFDKLSIAQQNMLFTEAFQVSKNNNRMAYQLLPLLQNTLEPILTVPVLPGTVQLTPSGQLIVLMRDAQTTGGYPRILQLTERSLNILSQKTTANGLKMRRSEL
ncbi:MAG: biotin-dependent carboxyltransferase family protein [Winogradskyella sp.]|uniref:5-oxoprolinase subunit C family protein n=1 Tax=Winogradskyella sp. TaxID=1883156 RepID=UPI00385AA9FC